MTIKLADLYIIEDSFTDEVRHNKVREQKSSYKKVRVRNQYRFINED
jgi:hypothetical protein